MIDVNDVQLSVSSEEAEKIPDDSSNETEPAEPYRHIIKRLQACWKDILIGLLTVLLCLMVILQLTVLNTQRTLPEEVIDCTKHETEQLNQLKKAMKYNFTLLSTKNTELAQSLERTSKENQQLQLLLTNASEENIQLQLLLNSSAQEKDQLGLLLMTASHENTQLRLFLNSSAQENTQLRLLLNHTAHEKNRLGLLLINASQENAQLRRFLNSTPQENEQHHLLLNCSAQEKTQLQLLLMNASQENTKLGLFLNDTVQENKQLQLLLNSTSQEKTELHLLLNSTAQEKTQLQLLLNSTSQEKTELQLLLNSTAQEKTQIQILLNSTVQERKELQQLLHHEQETTMLLHAKNQIQRQILFSDQLSFLWNFCDNHTLQCSRCMPGWLEHGSRCFFLFSETKDWETARINCLDLGGDLAVVQNADDQAFLTNLTFQFKKHHPELHAAWIGLQDMVRENTFVWVNGTRVKSESSYWRPHEPNNAVAAWDTQGLGQDCGAIVPHGSITEKGWLNTWDDIVCVGKRHFICETQSVNLS